MSKSKVVTKQITPQQHTIFSQYMAARELEESTQDKYCSALNEYEIFLGKRPASHTTLMEWRDYMRKQTTYSVSTINTKMAAVNAFFSSMDRKDCRVQLLTIQKQSYRDDSRDLNREEYFRLVAAARKLGRLQSELVLESLCSMGIRVTELQFLTVESLQDMNIHIYNKGKARKIRIPTALIVKLENYVADQGIKNGPVFLNKHGKPLTRYQIWAMLKRLSEAANVDSSKIFPHNLRHLFAKEYYKKYKDLAKLGDMLGHSNLTTTRIYLLDPGSEHARQIDSLDLIPD